MMFTLPDGHAWEETVCNITGAYSWECAETGATFTVYNQPDGSVTTVYVDEYGEEHHEEYEPEE